MFIVFYASDPQSDTKAASFGPFDSQAAAGEFAKANYRTGSMARRRWVVVPVAAPDEI